MIYSDKKNEMLPFVITWIDFDGIMRNEIAYRGKTNTV